jgi:beta-aspartyl-peptidase (threonine type)
VVVSAAPPPSLPNSRWALAVHGGAGAAREARIEAGREASIRAALAAVLDAGARALAAGASALDVVEQAVRALEDSPLFNAGRGAVRTAADTVELEASIMDGRTQRAGAVAVVRNVKNPITLARRVMDETPHVFLAGEGALAFARAQRLELEDDDYFRVAPASGHRSGTVGAVALDVHGDLAAATSTGGMTGKLPGRIGDSSVVGAGTYARNDACAVSCTGHGEFFIRATAARDVAAQFERGATLEAALAAVLDGRVGALGGNGGAIAVDRSGVAACAFNSGLMHRGTVTYAMPAQVGIHEGEAP